MKRNFKRTLAKVMAVALTVALAGTAAPEANAAKKAKAPKLSAKSVTIVKGKSKKVTIKNVKAKQVKKLAVSTSNKKIATVKKKGKTAVNVTGKKAGNAKVTVKVTVKGKKKATKLVLKVKVKNATPPKTSSAPLNTPAVTAAAPTATPPALGTPVPPTSTATATQRPRKTRTPEPNWEVMNVKNIQVGGEGAEELTLFKVEDGTAHLIYNKDNPDKLACYGHVYTYFDVVLPEGATVKDLHSVKFAFQGIAGDLGHKKIHLIAANTKAQGTDMDALPNEVQYKSDDGTFQNATDVSDSGYAYGFNGPTGDTPVEDEILIDPGKLGLVEGIENNTIRFCLYINLDGTQGTENSEYKLGNIRVLTSENVTVTEGQQKPGDTIDKTASVKPNILAELDRATIQTGQEINATAIVRNASIVGGVKEAKWSVGTGTSEILSITPDTADKTKATIKALKAGVETVSLEITTEKDKTAVFTTHVTVTDTKPVIEDKVLTLTTGNKVTIPKDTAINKGSGKIDISELIKDVNLADYENITLFGSATYNGEALESTQTLTLQLVNSDNSSTGLVTVFDITSSGLAATEEGGGKSIISATSSLQSIVSGSTMLKLLFQNATNLTEGDLEVTIDKVVLNAKKDVAEEPAE